MTTVSDQDLVRVLRRLASPGTAMAAAGDGSWIAKRNGIATGTIPAETAQAGIRRGLVSADRPGVFSLTAAGAAFLRRALATADETYPAQHQERGLAFVADAEGSHAVRMNQDESPLAWLRRRRDRNGRPMIDASAFAAGERLRSDFSRGQLMPRVTADWSATVAGRGRDGAHGSAEMTEVAMAARRRVETALQSVGPELGGLLLDFCCFLKGLEAIEVERQWPPRSAKVPLKLALTALARHYGLLREARGPARAGAIAHWGAPDYRPTVDGAA